VTKTTREEREALAWEVDGAVSRLGEGLGIRPAERDPWGRTRLSLSGGWGIGARGPMGLHWPVNGAVLSDGGEDVAYGLCLLAAEDMREPGRASLDREIYAVAAAELYWTPGELGAAFAPSAQAVSCRFNVGSADVKSIYRCVRKWLEIRPGETAEFLRAGGRRNKILRPIQASLRDVDSAAPGDFLGWLTVSAPGAAARAGAAFGELATLMPERLPARRALEGNGGGA
jgi:hypothetical protein